MRASARRLQLDGVLRRRRSRIHSDFRPGIDVDKLGQLADELEARLVGFAAR
jgi:hypothetical protein